MDLNDCGLTPRDRDTLRAQFTLVIISSYSDEELEALTVYEWSADASSPENEDALYSRAFVAYDPEDDDSEDARLLRAFSEIADRELGGLRWPGDA